MDCAPCGWDVFYRNNLWGGNPLQLAYIAGLRRRHAVQHCLDCIPDYIADNILVHSNKTGKLQLKTGRLRFSQFPEQVNVYFCSSIYKLLLLGYLNETVSLSQSGYGA